MSVTSPGSTGKSVVIVDDARLNRECLAAQLAANGITASVAWDLPSLLAEVDRSTPEAILLNVDTPDSATLLQLALDLDRASRVIVYGLSTDRESEIVSCAEAGVAGLHLRTESFGDLLTLTNSRSDGRAQCSAEISSILLRRVYAFAAQTNPDRTTDILTRREIEILELLEQGLTNQQIASRLSVTLHTVKNHVHSLLTKLGVGSRTEAVRVFRANRYATPGQG